MTIPRLIHQLAKTEAIAPHLQGCQASWRRLNPDFDYQLWTDSRLEAWVRAEAPEFLELYLGYPRSICRADLARYLLLDRIGGVYADLDCQCLQPISLLLDGRELAIACEPSVHHQQASVQERGFDQIVCPSFIASAAGHPFWRDVLEAIREVEPTEVLTNTDVLDATGPFLLSRVVASQPQHQQHLLPTPLIYPFSKEECWQGQIFDPAFWSARTRQAFVVHYWESSWFKASSQWRSGVPSQAPVHVRRPAAPAPLPTPTTTANAGTQTRPLISCLMVTRGRGQQARLAIDCYLAQSYDERELIIVDDDPASDLAADIAAIDGPGIRHLRLPDQGLSLGALRNIALDHAHGDYICQWDDDDLHDPVRLEVQLQTLLASGARASLLARWMIWWPHLNRIAVSCYRDWEGSLLCERAMMPRYPDKRSGEDSAVLQQLMEKIPIARIDLPRLYVYIYHGTNTFGSEHFEPHWAQATERWESDDHQRLLQELDRRVPLLRYAADLKQAVQSDDSEAAPPGER